MKMDIPWKNRYSDKNNNKTDLKHSFSYHLDIKETQFMKKKSKIENKTFPKFLTHGPGGGWSRDRPYLPSGLEIQETLR